MTLALACTAVLLLILIGLYVMAERAPMGYEDEDGFHYGKPPSTSSFANLSERERQLRLVKDLDEIAEERQAHGRESHARRPDDTPS